MRDIKFRTWNKINETMYGDAINNCQDSFDMVLKHPQIYVVMQYIGIIDACGVRIYEGDILLHEDSNWGYGGKYDKVNDGYLRTQVPSIEDLMDEYSDVDYEYFHFWEFTKSIYKEKYMSGSY